MMNVQINVEFDMLFGYRYVEWKNKLKRVKMLVKAEDLKGLKNIGNEAYSQLQSLLEETSTR